MGIIIVIKNVFTYIVYLHYVVFFLKQNTSTIAFIIISNSCSFFGVIAIYIDILKQILNQNLAKLYFKMHQIASFFPVEHAPVTTYRPVFV